MASTSGRRLAVLSLTALGIVYGDIGTSPLYAIRESLQPAHGLPVSAANVLGVLSCIVWSLIIVISIKYLGYILRADDHGEGGILALASLAEVRQITEQWRELYNTARPHRSLGRVPPRTCLPRTEAA